MYTFIDNYFQSEYNRYYDLKEQGMKKDANITLENLMDYFDNLESSVQKGICYELCMLYLDEKKISELQFPLSHRITKIIEADCADNKMPQLRWYYQLTGDKSALEKAYKCEPEDINTIKLRLDSFLYELWYGSHHMPYCCLIDKDKSEILLRNVKEMLEKYEDYDYREEYEHYQQLYSDWWKFEKEQSAKGFLEWCVKNKRNYDWVQEYNFGKEFEE